MSITTFTRAGSWGPDGVIDQAGRPQPHAAVALYMPDGVTLAARYVDATKAATAPNPWSADSLGNIDLFYANPGPYLLIVTVGETPTLLPIEVAIDPTEAALDEDVAPLVGYANLAALPAASAHGGRLAHTNDGAVYKSDGAAWLLVRDTEATFGMLKRGNPLTRTKGRAPKAPFPATMTATLSDANVAGSDIVPIGVGHDGTLWAKKGATSLVQCIDETTNPPTFASVAVHTFTHGIDSFTALANGEVAVGARGVPVAGSAGTPATLWVSVGWNYGLGATTAGWVQSQWADGSGPVQSGDGFNNFLTRCVKTVGPKVVACTYGPTVTTRSIATTGDGPWQVILSNNYAQTFKVVFDVRDHTDVLPTTNTDHTHAVLIDAKNGRLWIFGGDNEHWFAYSDDDGATWAVIRYVDPYVAGNWQPLIGEVTDAGVFVGSDSYPNGYWLIKEGVPGEPFKLDIVLRLDSLTTPSFLNVAACKDDQVVYVCGKPGSSVSAPSRIYATADGENVFNVWSDTINQTNQGFELIVGPTKAGLIHGYIDGDPSRFSGHTVYFKAPKLTWAPIALSTPEKIPAIVRRTGSLLERVHCSNVPQALDDETDTSAPDGSWDRPFKTIGKALTVANDRSRYPQGGHVQLGWGDFTAPAPTVDAVNNPNRACLQPKDGVSITGKGRPNQDGDGTVYGSRIIKPNGVAVGAVIDLSGLGGSHDAQAEHKALRDLVVEAKGATDTFDNWALQGVLMKNARYMDVDQTLVRHARRAYEQARSSGTGDDVAFDLYLSRIAADTCEYGYYGMNTVTTCFVSIDRPNFRRFSQSAFIAMHATGGIRGSSFIGPTDGPALFLAGGNTLEIDDLETENCAGRRTWLNSGSVSIGVDATLLNIDQAAYLHPVPPGPWDVGNRIVLLSSGAYNAIGEPTGNIVHVTTIQAVNKPGQIKLTDACPVNLDHVAFYILNGGDLCALTGPIWYQPTPTYTAQSTGAIMLTGATVLTVAIIQEGGVTGSFTPGPFTTSDAGRVVQVERPGGNDFYTKVVSYVAGSNGRQVNVIDAIPFDTDQAAGNRFAIWRDQVSTLAVDALQTNWSRTSPGRAKSIELENCERPRISGKVSASAFDEPDFLGVHVHSNVRRHEIRVFAGQGMAGVQGPPIKDDTPAGSGDVWDAGYQTSFPKFGFSPTATTREVWNISQFSWQWFNATMTSGLSRVTLSPSTAAITAADTVDGTIAAAGHRLRNGDTVTLSGGSLPAGLSAGVTYFVVGSDRVNGTFQLTRYRPGNLAIVPTVTGTGTATTTARFTAAMATSPATYRITIVYGAGDQGDSTVSPVTSGWITGFVDSNTVDTTIVAPQDITDAIVIVQLLEPFPRLRELGSGERQRGDGQSNPATLVRDYVEQIVTGLLSGEWRQHVSQALVSDGAVRPSNGLGGYVQGTGQPEGVAAAPPGTLYGEYSTIGANVLVGLWVKRIGTGTTGWQAVVHAPVISTVVVSDALTTSPINVAWAQTAGAWSEDTGVNKLRMTTALGSAGASKASLTQDLTANDITAQVDVTTSSGTTHAGLSVRESDADNALFAHITIQSGTSPSVILKKRVAGAETTLLAVGNQAWVVSTTYTVKVVAEGRNVKVYVGPQGGTLALLINYDLTDADVAGSGAFLMTATRGGPHSIVANNSDDGATRWSNYSATFMTPSVRGGEDGTLIFEQLDPATVSTPLVGTSRVFRNQSTGHLNAKHSDGTLVDLEPAGSTPYVATPLGLGVGSPGTDTATFAEGSHEHPAPYKSPQTFDSRLALTEGATGGTNRCIWSRNLLGAAASVTKVGVDVGATSNGFISVALYANSGSGRSAVPVAQNQSSGAVACPSASAYAEIAVTSTAGRRTSLVPDDWMALSNSGGTATFARINAVRSSVSQGYSCLADTSHPAPDPSGISSASASVTAYTPWLIGVP